MDKHEKLILCYRQDCSHGWRDLDGSDPFSTCGLDIISISEHGKCSSYSKYEKPIPHEFDPDFVYILALKFREAFDFAFHRHWPPTTWVFVLNADMLRGMRDRTMYITDNAINREDFQEVYQLAKINNFTIKNSG